MLLSRHCILLSAISSFPRGINGYLLHLNNGIVGVPQNSPTQRLKGGTVRYFNLSPERETFVRNSLGKDRTIVDHPFSWEDLVDIVVHKKDPTLHSRSLNVQDKYLRFTDEVKRDWVSVNDHILHTKFQFEKRLEGRLEDGEKESVEMIKMEGLPNGCRWKAYPPLSEVNRVERRLLLNEFPYFVEDGIEHWCLWKLCENVTDEDILFAKSELAKMSDDRGTVADTLCWVNPPHLKSVPDIDHAHILCLRGKK